MNHIIKKVGACLLCVQILNLPGLAYAATTCSVFQQQIQDRQMAARNADINTAWKGFTSVADMARQMKKACIDNVVSQNVSSYGMGSIGTQLLLAAATNVCDAAAQKLNSSVQQQVNGVNQNINGVVNQIPQGVRAPVTSTTRDATRTTDQGGVWSTLRSFLN